VTRVSMLIRFIYFTQLPFNVFHTVQQMRHCSLNDWSYSSHQL